MRSGIGGTLTGGFHLYVELTASAGNTENLNVALQSLSRASMASGMCQRFDVSQSQMDPDTFHLFESFASKEVYPDHVATPHAQHFLSFVVPNYVAKRSVIFLEETPFTN
jgi:quinol monooxygenase YgiN